MSRGGSAPALPPRPPCSRGDGAGTTDRACAACHHLRVTKDEVRLADVLGPGSDPETARAAIIFLEGRLVLTEPPDREDFESCRRAVSDIRDYLGSAMTKAVPAGGLESSLRRMRKASMN